MTRRPTASSGWLEWAALALILAVAAWLRTLGLGFGLPAVYNPDETAIVSRALAFAKGDLNPHNFLYPTFFFYALFAWIGGAYVVARLTGQVASAAAFQARFFTDPSDVYLAGRALGVVCGIVTVFLVWRLGRRLFGRAAGLMAAALLATAPCAVRDAHYVKHDVAATLLVVLAMLAIVRAWPGGTDGAGSRRDELVAAAACGVAFATHYYTVFLALPLAYAIWLRQPPGGAPAVLRALGRAGVAASVLFFALSPFILIEPAIAWRDIVANRAIVVDRAVQSGGFLASAGAYLRMLTGDAIGLPVVIAATGAAIWLLWTAPHLAVLLILFPLAFLGFISNTVPASRYLNPVLPFVALLAGAGLARAVRDRRFAGVLGVAATMALAAPGGRESYHTGRFFEQTDTRSLALEFVARTIPPKSTILVQPYSVPLAQSRESLVEALEAHLGDAGRASTKFAMRLALDPYPAPAYRTIYLGDGGLDVDKIYVGYAELGGAAGLDRLRRLGVAYVAVKRYNRPDPATRPFLDALAREARRLAVFSPYKSGITAERAARVEPFLHNTDTPIDDALERPGPLVEIWELNDGPRASS